MSSSLSFSPRVVLLPKGKIPSAENMRDRVLLRLLDLTDFFRPQVFDQVAARRCDLNLATLKWTSGAFSRIRNGIYHRELLRNVFVQSQMAFEKNSFTL